MVSIKGFIGTWMHHLGSVWVLMWFTYISHLIGSLEYHKDSLSIIKISLRVSVGSFRYHWDPVSYLGTILILIGLLLTLGHHRGSYGNHWG